MRNYNLFDDYRPDWNYTIKPQMPRHLTTATSPIILAKIILATHAPFVAAGIDLTMTLSQFLHLRAQPRK